MLTTQEMDVFTFILNAVIILVIVLAVVIVLQVLLFPCFLVPPLHMNQSLHCLYPQTVNDSADKRTNTSCNRPPFFNAVVVMFSLPGYFLLSFLCAYFVAVACVTKNNKTENERKLSNVDNNRIVAEVLCAGS